MSAWRERAEAEHRRTVTAMASEMGRAKMEAATAMAEAQTSDQLARAREAELLDVQKDVEVLRAEREVHIISGEIVKGLNISLAEDCLTHAAVECTRRQSFYAVHTLPMRGDNCSRSDLRWKVSSVKPFEVAVVHPP